METLVGVKGNDFWLEAYILEHKLYFCVWNMKTVF